MVHRPKRLAEILSGMEGVGIAPRTLRFVHSREGEPASLVLVSGVRGGGKELRVLPPLIIYSEGGGYKPDVYEIYYGDRTSSVTRCVTPSPKGEGRSLQEERA